MSISPAPYGPKHDGRGYTLVFDNLEALADGGDPNGAEALVEWVAGESGTQGPTVHNGTQV